MLEYIKIILSNKEKQQESKYPNRYKQIHKVSCKNCPSVVGPIDPEAEQVKTYSRQEQINTTFLCGWRGSKLCKGYCDDLNITESDLTNRNVI